MLRCGCQISIRHGHFEAALGPSVPAGCRLATPEQVCVCAISEGPMQWAEFGLRGYDSNLQPMD